ncbi:hypothetical protein H4Q26_003753 [Puccinia striiformis f. sp. tritici PST-130]|nr:hypothetical protein H4Q26_003753 [Puccinia striiformis f. sp. tritici PST-130]
MDEKMFMKSLVNRLPHLDDCFTLGVIQRPAKAMVKLLAWSGCEFYGPLGELHPDTPPQNNIFRCDCECPTARHGFNPIKFNDQMTDGPSHHVSAVQVLLSSENASLMLSPENSVEPWNSITTELMQR